MKKNQITRRDASDWQKIIKDQESSGQSAAVYCRQEGLGEKNFYAWRRRLKEATFPGKQSFVEVSTEHKNQNETIRITTPGGYCIAMSADIQINIVKDILGVIK